ncbi:hypothetical protein Gohar_010140, partial [Gossypium harknessii]|nr:hypothetical protein [Gossypium harknessii]
FCILSEPDQNVVEVNKTDYEESCSADHPLHNWTAGTGRDVDSITISLAAKDSATVA